VRGSSLVAEVMTMPRIGERIRLEGFALTPHIRFFEVTEIMHPVAIGQLNAPLMNEVKVKLIKELSPTNAIRIEKKS
jgi:hypothetical protein